MEVDSTPPHGPDWRGASVLIVDDESPIRKIIRRNLEAQAFQVEEADNGEAALRLIQSRSDPFHLVLTDLMLPEIDGWQVAVTLRQYRPSVGVICMSAHPKAVPPIDHVETPVPVLEKPFTAEHLCVAIRREITRAAELTALTESEIAEAHAESGKLAAELQESRTARAQMMDLITAARELRAVAAASTSSTSE